MIYKIWFTNWHRPQKEQEHKNPRRRPEIKVRNEAVAKKVCEGLRKAGYLVFMAWD